MQSYELPIHKNSLEAKRCRKILKQLNIRFRVNWGKHNPQFWGMALGAQNRIIIYPRAVSHAWVEGLLVELFPVSYRYHSRPLTVQEFTATVMHEIAHILAVRQKLYLHYNLGLKRNATRRYFHKWASQALRAERRADSDGRLLMAEYFPEIPYISHYDGEKGKRVVRNMIDTVREYFDEP